MENLLFLGVPILKHIRVADFANMVEPDKAARYEPPNLGLHCLLSNP